MKTKTPCLDCTKREVGCHGKCEEYKAFTEKGNEVKKRRQAEYRRNYNYTIIHWDEVEVQDESK